jgi:hypothetical protein
MDVPPLTLAEIQKFGETDLRLSQVSGTVRGIFRMWKFHSSVILTESDPSSLFSQFQRLISGQDSISDAEFFTGIQKLFNSSQWILPIRGKTVNKLKTQEIMSVILPNPSSRLESSKLFFSTMETHARRLAMRAEHEFVTLMIAEGLSLVNSVGSLRSSVYNVLREEALKSFRMRARSDVLFEKSSPPDSHYQGIYPYVSNLMPERLQSDSPFEALPTEENSSPSPDLVDPSGNEGPTPMAFTSAISLLESTAPNSSSESRTNAGFTRAHKNSQAGTLGARKKLSDSRKKFLRRQNQNQNKKDADVSIRRNDLKNQVSSFSRYGESLTAHLPSSVRSLTSVLIGLEQI